jgi:hypothetical protein
LSNDLSSIAAESKQEEASETTEEEVVETTEESAEKEVAEENSSEEVEESKEEAEDASDEKVSDDNSEKADEQAEEAVDSEQAEKPEEKLEDTQAQSEESAQQDTSLNDEKNGVTESEYAEILQKNKALQEENQKLRGALHKTLVDAKIVAGVEAAEVREELIEEHAKRTASSLADSLRDLAKMPQVVETKSSMPEIAFEAEIVEGEDNAFTVGNEAKEVKESKALAPEQLFVDALMGRRKL